MLKLLAPGLWAGLVASVILSVIQAIWVSPLILQAETYEQSTSESEQHETSSHAAHSHEHAHEHSHEHDENSWAPEDGWQRHVATAGSNLVMAVGFGMILTGLFWLRPPMSWKSGAVWGSAGYLVFFVAPGLGLPPELPGTVSAALESRQFWWLATAGATAAAFALLAFSSRKLLQLFALVLLLAPHFIGAPQPEAHSALAPDTLLRQFQWSSAAVNAVFWLVLGIASAVFFLRTKQADHVGAAV